MFQKTFFLLLCFFFSNNIQAQPLADGLIYQKKVTASGATLHVFRINPWKYEMRPFVTESGKTASVKGMATTAHALLMVNANFFDTNNLPLGLVIDRKKILHSFKKISWWGVFGFRQKGRAEVIAANDFPQTKDWSMAIQAGPRLVVGGKLTPFKNQFSAKTAVGINTHGEVVIVVSRDAMMTDELAKIMALDEKKGGLSCVEVLNLDGGSSSQLFAHVGDFVLDVPSFATVPVGLGIWKK